MNIKITYNWLLEYLDTDADPTELQKYLSLCGPSVEKVERSAEPAGGGKKDYVLDIEVTSNRVDMASVWGVAQEASAILPQFGKKAILKENPFKQHTFDSLPKGTENLKLDVEIKDSSLCSRFAAIVLSDISIQKSDSLILERVRACGIKSINNVVDSSNYLMLALGQPTHVFDYDKIKDGKMILRESKKGEKITTLDEKEIILPGGDIVIEDGSGKLIDLCGIMGGLNSAVTAESKNIVLFVQTYNKQKIRKTSMTTGQRSVAAAYFEKGLDEEQVEPTLVYGVKLLEKYAGAVVASPLYDIYPAPYKPHTVTVGQEDISRLIGVDLDNKTCVAILTNLGFEVEKSKNALSVKVPPTRKYDITIKQDIIEEIARIYGYHNLPNNLSPMAYVTPQKELVHFFLALTKAKYFLKHLSLHESVNYSMISRELIENFNLGVEHHLPLLETISEELKYMRISLLPSLTKNIKENTGKTSVLRFFEIAKVYYPQKGDLPKEVYKLGIATNTGFFDLKGVIEELLSELNISEYEIKRGSVELFSPHIQADILIKGAVIGTFGQLRAEIQSKSGLSDPVFLAGIDFQTLVDNAKPLSKYKPINPFAEIKLDLTLSKNKKVSYAEFKKRAHVTSALLRTTALVDMFKDKITVRFYFTAQDRNITEVEAKDELEKIKKNISS